MGAILIVVVIIILLLYFSWEGLDQPTNGDDPSSSGGGQPTMTVKTVPTYTVVNTATGAITVPGDIDIPKVPIYAAKTRWNLYLQRGSHTIKGKKHPMYMRGDPTSWVIYLNSLKKGKHRGKYEGNLR